MCAVSFDDVRAIAREIPSHPRVISLDPSTVGEVLEDVRRLGAATGRELEAQALLRDAAERIDRVRTAVGGARRPRVAALEWLDPVYVAGHWTPQLIEYAGGQDVLGFTGERSAQARWDEVARSRPDVVVVMPCGYDAPRAREEALAHRAALDALGAGQVVAVDTRTFKVEARIPTGPRPRSVVFTRDGATAFVTSENGAQLTVIDVAKNQPAGTKAALVPSRRRWSSPLA